MENQDNLRRLNNRSLIAEKTDEGSALGDGYFQLPIDKLPIPTFSLNIDVLSLKISSSSSEYPLSIGGCERPLGREAEIEIGCESLDRRTHRRNRSVGISYFHR